MTNATPIGADGFNWREVGEAGSLPHRTRLSPHIKYIFTSPSINSRFEIVAVNSQRESRSFRRAPDVRRQSRQPAR
jgi:hypothetical protein